MGAIDSLTRFFDNLKGAQNTYHASDMTDEQRQKMYDDRAKSLMSQYDAEYDGENDYIFGDSMYEEAPYDRNKLHNKYPSGVGYDNTISPRYADNETYDTVAYDFTYRYPTSGNGGYYGESISTPSMNNFGKARVYMRVPKGASNDLNQLFADNSTAVYGAVLEDGTKLDANQLREFLKINELSGGIYGNVQAKDSGHYPGLSTEYNEYARQKQDAFSGWLQDQYGGYNSVDARQYGSYEEYLDALNGAKPVVPRWDKNSRSWRTW